MMLMIMMLLHLDPMNLRMEQSILANGKMVIDMEKENNFGMMVLSMKDIGKIILLMEKVD